MMMLMLSSWSCSSLLRILNLISLKMYWECKSWLYGLPLSWLSPGVLSIIETKFLLWKLKAIGFNFLHYSPHDWRVLQFNMFAISIDCLLFLKFLVIFSIFHSKTTIVKDNLWGTCGLNTCEIIYPYTVMA